MSRPKKRNLGGRPRLIDGEATVFSISVSELKKQEMTVIARIMGFSGVSELMRHCYEYWKGHGMEKPGKVG